MLNCNSCPTDNQALGDISASNCGFDLKQVQKLIFGVRGADTWDLQTGNDPKLLADWSTRLGASDETRLIVTPFIGGDPTFTASEASTRGGNDNSTLGGITEVLGGGPGSFSTRYDSMTPKQERDFKAFHCENTRLSLAGFITEDKVIYMRDDSALLDESALSGWDCLTYFFSDRTNEGKNTKDYNMMTFQLNEGWSGYLVKVVPTDFNPLQDLVNPVV